MSLANRSHSPIFQESNKRDKKMNLDANKIHRLIIETKAVCNVAYVVSPSCIFFKLKNTISEKLKYVKPYDIKQFLPESDKANSLIYTYVMAPIDEKVYARGRIIKQAGRFVYVHFIDEGHGTWMQLDCLAKMEPEFQHHPWQAFPLTLFKIAIEKVSKADDQPQFATENLRINGNSTEAQWPANIVNKLEAILSEYDCFQIAPIFDSRQNDMRQKPNYFEYMRAEVYGIRKDDPEPESIAHRFIIEMASHPQKNMVEESRILTECFQRDFFDAKQQSLLMPMDLEILTETGVQNMPIWRQKFPHDFASNLLTKKVTIVEKSQMTDDREWDPQQSEPFNYNIPITSCTDWLFGNVPNGKKKKCFVCMDWSSLKSPYHFYAYFLSPNTYATQKDSHQIRRLFKAQQRRQSELNDFYGRQANRRDVNCGELAQSLRRGPVYAIYEHNDGNTVSSFRRVRVISIRNMNANDNDMEDEFCRVRFLDVGGADIVPLAGLLKIHSRHCKDPPLCAQLFIPGIPKPSPELSGEVKEKFKKLARSDVPIECDLKPHSSGQKSKVDIIRSMLSNCELSMTGYNDMPEDWPDVLDASEMRPVVGEGDVMSIDSELLAFFAELDEDLFEQENGA